MSDWPEALADLVRAGTRAVLVSVIATRGSVPREAGAKMIVTAQDIAGTIGGGRLEFEAMARARELLSAAGAAGVETFPLGPQLGQCCGGVATLLFEPLDSTAAGWTEALVEKLAQPEPITVITRCGTAPAVKEVLVGSQAPTAALPPVLLTALESSAKASIVEESAEFTWVVERLTQPRQPLLLFGAGHVGTALAAALAPLPFAVTWIDSRPEAFPAEPPAKVTVEVCDPPRLAVARAPAGAIYLVMTHSHALDFELCDAVLRRADMAYLGLIGSKTKRARFEARLLARGHGTARLKDLTCPIGLPEIAGKEPPIIAASVAADLLRRRSPQRRA